MLKKLDFYIIRKFLGTFFYAIALIISIAIIFDFSEKIDDFIEKEAPFREVFMDYYLNFIPYFANLFSGLFTFIAVIYFTSKMAYDSEIIAILSSGVSYKRLMRPYLVSAAVIAILSWTLGNFVIPHANETKLNFEYQYLKKRKGNSERNIHLQVEKNLFVYMSKYNTSTDLGHKFTLERFDDQNKLVSKLTSENIKWDRERKIWVINRYTIRDIEGEKETLSHGKKIDTVLNMNPSDFSFDKYTVESLDFFEMNKHIKEQKLRGVSNVLMYELEKHKRSASAFSAFILSIIGVSLASRKIRGGIGLHLGLGLLLSFTYILFQQVSKVFAIDGSLNAFMAAWLPNFVFAIIAVVLYRRAAQ
ncbi:YjgP/YjgQ family permease [Puteibacter caeruleilacunae]|nr:YjgP/YjgQ family permease [Puteibacter caeruleilacunae]